MALRTDHPRENATSRGGVAGRALRLVRSDGTLTSRRAQR